MLLQVIKKNEIFFIFKNFDFLWYFWHKRLIKILMPKVPQKVKILEKNCYFKIKKKHYIFINVDCWRSTSTPLHFSWSTSTRLHFSWLTSTRLNFLGPSTVDAHWRPFYSPFHHALLFPLFSNNNKHIIKRSMFCKLGRLNWPSSKHEKISLLS